jgi:hypothetical protein
VVFSVSVFFFAIIIIIILLQRRCSNARPFKIKGTSMPVKLQSISIHMLLLRGAETELPEKKNNQRKTSLLSEFSVTLEIRNEDPT